MRLTTEPWSGLENFKQQGQGTHRHPSHDFGSANVSSAHRSLICNDARPTRKTTPAKSDAQATTRPDIKPCRQRLHRYGTPALGCTTQRRILSKSEFENCRRALKVVIQRCSDFEFLHLSTLISCLLHCFRPLQRFELEEILSVLHQTPIDQDENDRVRSENDLAWLSQKCREIVFVDAAGFVRFTHPMIQEFLRTCNIVGIDRSHQTLAKACVTQIESNIEAQTSQEHQALAPTFATYAAKHWVYHYRHVQGTAPGLTARVHRMIVNGMSRRSMASDCQDDVSPHSLSRGVNQAALDISTELNLTVLRHLYQQMLSHQNAGHIRRQVPSRQPLPIDVCVEEALEALHVDDSDSTGDEEWVLIESKLHTAPCGIGV